MTTFSAETVKVMTEGLTLNIIIWRKFKRSYEGVMESVLATNLGLADLCPILPVGTVFTIPETKFDNSDSSDVVNLWD